MAENNPSEIELKQQQLEFLDEMAKKHGIADRSKVVRCLIAYAMEEPSQQASIFDEVRCLHCG